MCVCVCVCVREREREGSDVTIVALKLAMGLHFPKFLKKDFILHSQVPYRPTDDEVVYSKRLGNKVLVDLNRSNPLTVI